MEARQHFTAPAFLRHLQFVEASDVSGRVSYGVADLGFELLVGLCEVSLGRCDAVSLHGGLVELACEAGESGITFGAHGEYNRAHLFEEWFEVGFGPLQQG